MLGKVASNLCTVLIIKSYCSPFVTHCVSALVLKRKKIVIRLLDVVLDVCENDVFVKVLFCKITERFPV